MVVGIVENLVVDNRNGRIDGLNIAAGEQRGIVCQLALLIAHLHGFREFVVERGLCLIYLKDFGSHEAPERHVALAVLRVHHVDALIGSHTGTIAIGEVLTFGVPSQDISSEVRFSLLGSILVITHDRTAGSRTDDVASLCLVELPKGGPSGLVVVIGIDILYTLACRIARSVSSRTM